MQKLRGISNVILGINFLRDYLDESVINMRTLPTLLLNGNFGTFDNYQLSLRHNAPFAICTLCTGEMRVAKEHHIGVLRHIDGFTQYTGE